MVNVLKLYHQALKLPFGKHVFSFLFCLKAPYFRTIRPLVRDVRKNSASVRVKQHWGIQNHIQTVHAIAVCNLVEMTMGLVAEASIPPHLRWLPKGMDISYLKKCTGELTATANIPDNFFELEKYPGDVHVPVDVCNADGVVVTSAKVCLYISEKPTKK
ncbi:unnamed protein product [Ectocarpus fasciculatus]